MSENKLGRGLEYLFDQNKIADDIDESKIEEIQIVDIKPNPFQPRKKFNQEKLAELSQSIKENGLVQPILMRRGIINYEIISGERRYRATILAGLTSIKAIIYDFSDQQMIEVGIIENVQREDLSQVEEARAYKLMVDKLNLTQQEVATRVGKSRSYITNKMRLLNLDEYTLEILESGKISESHAKRLISIENPATRDQLLAEILSSNISVRELEQKSSGKTKQTINKKIKNSEFQRLETAVREQLKTKVNITGERSGKLEIFYSSKENLNDILEKLGLLNNME